jgi:hypothetical protein
MKTIITAGDASPEEAFLQIWLCDQELLREEFDEIIAA